MQGCPLRCACCHNPDTWDMTGGTLIDSRELFNKIYRLRSYFGAEGGLTASGGEPLMQAEFLTELFSLCKDAGISTAIDTSGCVYNEKVERLLELSDIVLLDYKYVDGDKYERYVGMKKERAESFMNELERLGKRVWIRQVIIPSLNDSEREIELLADFCNTYSCIEKVELLPFRKLCIEKYNTMGIEFLLNDIPEASVELMDRLNRILFERIKK
jgi:pyruvate formate lyase activating enzyme